ncbi:hypothetical protein SAMN04488062_1364, partial [Flavobacterium omnivorum]
MSSPFFE